MSEEIRFAYNIDGDLYPVNMRKIKNKYVLEQLILKLEDAFEHHEIFFTSERELHEEIDDDTGLPIGIKKGNSQLRFYIKDGDI